MVDDCNKILQLNPSFAKAFYRKGQSLLALERFQECIEVCHRGLQEAPECALEKVLEAAEAKLAAENERRAKQMKSATAAQLDLKRAVDLRGISYSMVSSADIPRQFSPKFEVRDSKLATSILVFYPEFQQVDTIQEASEDDSLFGHIASVLEEGLPWDANRNYLDPADVNLYLLLQRRELFTGTQCEFTDQRLFKLDRKASVLEALRTKNYVVPGCLEVFLVSSKSPFEKHFLSKYE